MNIPREAKKAEAIRRMKALHYIGQSNKEFEKYDKIMINEPPWGAHFYVDDDKELLEKIKELEASDNILVYAVIRCFMSFDGETLPMDSLLFVEDCRDEWEYFDEVIKDKIIMSTFVHEFGHLVNFMLTHDITGKTVILVDDVISFHKELYFS